MDFRIPDYEIIPVSSRGGSQVPNWGIDFLKVAEVWPKFKGEGLVVGVFDTEKIFLHPDLVDNSLNEYAGDGTGENSDVSHGHGIHVAGIAAARDNDFGAIGVAPGAKIVPLKCLTSSGWGSWNYIDKMVDHFIKIKEKFPNDTFVGNFSLGGTAGSSVLEKAMQKLFNAGIMPFAASGNMGCANGVPTSGFPAGYGEVTSIASLDSNGKSSVFSSCGKVEFAFPGNDIHSTHKDNGYARLSGTSMATPFAAALLGMTWAYYRNRGMYKSINEFLEFAKSAATALGEKKIYGFGVPFATDLIKEVPKPDPEPDPKPEPETLYTVSDVVDVILVDDKAQATSLFSYPCGRTLNVDVGYKLAGNSHDANMAALTIKQMVLFGIRSQVFISKDDKRGLVKSSRTKAIDSGDLPGVAKYIYEECVKQAGFAKIEYVSLHDGYIGCLYPKLG